ncbi:MAG TPA: DUF2837 family protein, partial [Novosphingobium sp.]|nr:DUF2837 family protein [Novosphingobium sp.]
EAFRLGLMRATRWMLDLLEPDGAWRQAAYVPGFIPAYYSRAVWGVLAANCLAQALITVGVIASLYAGYLNPEYRVTASQLSAVINGVATILLFALIDPQLSVMTDDVVDGRVSEPLFRRTIVWISFSRLAGTLLTQVLFLPAAQLVAAIANHV